MNLDKKFTFREIIRIAGNIKISIITIINAVDDLTIQNEAPRTVCPWVNFKLTKNSRNMSSLALVKSVNPTVGNIIANNRRASSDQQIRIAQPGTVNDAGRSSGPHDRPRLVLDRRSADVFRVYTFG
ncbi:unnamed protein product [Nesidiocoris tenuis]|uniref:Uncharacterized protein n=1 Tax=Nesidiocoris tenuis TaxID=355587 RepID=A0A6H5G0A3_9HEMI|nr:unnamed protein product [Nesidiocoris tenuis]